MSVDLNKLVELNRKRTFQMFSEEIEASELELLTLN